MDWRPSLRPRLWRSAGPCIVVRKSLRFLEFILVRCGGTAGRQANPPLTSARTLHRATGPASEMLIGPTNAGKTTLLAALSNKSIRHLRTLLATTEVEPLGAKSRHGDARRCFRSPLRRHHGVGQFGTGIATPAYIPFTGCAASHCRGLSPGGGCNQTLPASHRS